MAASVCAQDIVRMYCVCICACTRALAAPSLMMMMAHIKMYLARTQPKRVHARAPYPTAFTLHFGAPLAHRLVSRSSSSVRGILQHTPILLLWYIYSSSCVCALHKRGEHAHTQIMPLFFINWRSLLCNFVRRCRAPCTAAAAAAVLALQTLPPNIKMHASANASTCTL